MTINRCISRNNRKKRETVTTATTIETNKVRNISQNKHCLQIEAFAMFCIIQRSPNFMHFDDCTFCNVIFVNSYTTN